MNNKPFRNKIFVCNPDDNIIKIEMKYNEEHHLDLFNIFIESALLLEYRIETNSDTVTYEIECIGNEQYKYAESLLKYFVLIFNMAYTSGRDDLIYKLEKDKKTTELERLIRHL